MFKSIEELRGWLAELAADVADIICPGLPLNERVVFEALATEMTTAEIMALCQQ
jgi:hypothetical protein